MANAINTLELNENKYVLTLPYAVCATAANTVAKVVTLDNFSLETGVSIVVKFTYSNSASSPTLNVNSTGAAAIKRYGSTNASTSAGLNSWHAGAVCVFTYDGAYWIMHDQSDDTKVTQNARTTNGEFPMLLRGASAGTSNTTTSTSFSTGITANPSTNTITATTFNGTATKAATDANGNNIAQTYLTVQSHDLNPTETGKFFCGKKNSIIYVDLSVSYISIYISKDFGKTWTHLSNTDYTYYSGTRYYGNYIYQHAPGDLTCSDVLIYNLSYNNRYYYTIINPDTATLEFKVQKYLLEGTSSSKVFWNSCAMHYNDNIAAVHKEMNGSHYIGLIDSTSNTLLCGYEKTGADSYSVPYIGMNEIESSTTRKIYYYFFCDFDDMTANKQRIYRIVHTYTYSSGADTYSQSTITSGYSSFLYMYKLIQVGLNSFVYSPTVFADYDYAGENYYYTTVGSVTNGTYTAITLPEKLANIQIMPLVFDQTFIIYGIGGGGEPINFLVDLKSSSYTDPYGDIYEQATGVYTPVRTSLNVPFCYYGITPINNGEYFIAHAYNTTIKSIVGKWYVGSENYQYARTQKNEIYCNGDKIGEFYQ